MLGYTILLKAKSGTTLTRFSRSWHFPLSIRCAQTPKIYHPIWVRRSSSDASLTDRKLAVFPNRAEIKATEPSALARLPTSSITRSLFLGAFFSSPMLFAPGFALLKRITNSPSGLLSPDRNPLVRAIVKPIIYDQFCAGTNKIEIRAKVSQIKSLGFSGVILCYGKELQIRSSSHSQIKDNDEPREAVDQELEFWKQGNLETLDMICDGDYLGIKYDFSPIS